MDRLIIVVHLNDKYVSMNNENLQDHLDSVRKTIQEPLDEDDICWIVPTKEETRIELVNKPIIVVDEKQAKELKKQINELEKSLLNGFKL